MIGPGTKSVMWMNPQGYIYINGDEVTDGSRRFSVNSDTNIPVIEKRIDGLWQPTSFEAGPDTIWAGLNVGIGGVGHHLVTTSSDGHLHFHAHCEFDGETCVKDTQIENVYFFTEKYEYQPDDSGSWTGTVFEFLTQAPSHTIVKKGYIKTDTVAATKSVRIQTWQGTDDTGIPVFDQWYPASAFSALTEVVVDYHGYSEFEKGNNYFTRYSSDADFSMKMNTEETWPWVATDIAQVRENALLQEMIWEENYNFLEEQWIIENRKIYICNTAGVQTGTFESNLDKWNVLSPSIYTWETIVVDTKIRIPENHQMTAHDIFNLEGDLLLEGTLVVRN